MTELGPIERLLRRDRLITVGALALLCAGAWAYILGGAGMPSTSTSGMTGMSHMSAMPDMTAAASNAEPTLADARDFLLGVLMWWSMMIAMMAPSASPMVLLYARVARTTRGSNGERVLSHTGWFVAGYLAVWLMFSLLATLLQHGLTRVSMLSPETLSVANHWFVAGVLILAGLYQLSPVQDVCLSHCRAPASFLAQHYRPGAIGALRLGELHGSYCVGCCWLLMALLFVGGLMNLAWIAALTVLVAAQKILPGGHWIGRVAGLALIVGGVMSLL
jgi:predicted metal-binding membrane protein